MLFCRSHRTGWGGGWGLTGFSHAGGPEFPPSCGSGPVAVGSGLWGRSQLYYLLWGPVTPFEASSKIKKELWMSIF